MSNEEHLVEEGKLSWPEVSFCVSGLVNQISSYTVEERWRAPHYVVAAAGEESLSDVLSRVRISYSVLGPKPPRKHSGLWNVDMGMDPFSQLTAGIVPDAKEWAKLISGQDIRWRLYGVDFEDEDRIVLHFMYLDTETMKKDAASGIVLDFRDVEEIALQFVQVDDSSPNSIPERKIAYKRARGNGKDVHTALHLQDCYFGHEIVQVFGKSFVRTHIPATLRLDVPIDAL